MRHLTPRERELVALGAALGSNCVPCIEFHIPASRKAGLTNVQILEAIRLADKVRKVPARKVLDTATDLLSGAATPLVEDEQSGTVASTSVVREGSARAVSGAAVSKGALARQSTDSDNPCCN